MQAPPEPVWELASDTSRYAEWVIGTDEVTRTDGPAREGSTYDERNTILGPWKASAKWRVTEFTEGRRQVHESGDVPFVKRLLVIMELEPEADVSLLTLTLRAEGSGLFGRLMKPGVERDNRKTVGQFAELARREL